ncbi:EamA family transporter [Pararhodobacter marinus]|uniref:EamA family transporter n=1 Tax=Pararhodobacter marinus TaxID=2184063 RepID=A0A2U2CIY0_9RHOB|nr:DMT family transporter [Pararhodobacter marinus]PWE31822.1 EamA family transporter [Pararhodobacter marinus]
MTATALPVALLGGLCAVGASLGFSLNDMAIKFLSGAYPLHQVVLIRSVIALAIMLAVVIPFSGGYGILRTRMPGKHVLRGCFIVMANMTYFIALAAMPIADATAIFFVSPLVIALFSIVFLGETVGPRRWTAIGLGLSGVVVMIRPGTDAFTPIALLPLLAATAYAGLHTMTRHIGLRETAATMATYSQFTFLGFSIVFGLIAGRGDFLPADAGPSMDFLLRGWIWPQWRDVPFFCLAGIGTALGGLLIAQAYRLCEAALVAPLEYVAMPMAIVWGVAVFGEWPDLVSWIGITLILGAGIYLIWRETRNTG